jgi:acylphosphatase
LYYLLSEAFMALAAFKATVQGWVQGVSFRAFVVRHASRLGVSGYVRNTREGLLEVIAEGDTDKLEELISYLKQGPPAARIDNLEIIWQSEQTGKYSGFTIKY